ncbi:MAG: hypothetical protein C4581_08545 [Nitrospiraceae bacterium]|nr:MAG: hypothetical protein C4581_08545 [Nitrospiraceae bacterium]
MKKSFILIFSFIVLYTGAAMAGTTIALRGDGNVLFIDEAREEVTGKVSTGGVAGSLGSISPDGKTLYVSNSFLGHYTVSIIDVQNRTLIKNLPTGSRPKHGLVSPDGKFVGVNHLNCEMGKLVIAIIDTYSNTVKHSVRTDIKKDTHKGDMSAHNVWTRDSKYFITQNYADNTVHIIDAAAGKEAARLQLDGNPHYFVISPDNKELWVIVEGEEDASGNIMGCPKVNVFDISKALTAGPEVLAEGSYCMILNPGEASEAHHGAFTLDGKYFYLLNRGPAPDLNGTSVNVFDAATKKQVAHLTTGGKGDGHPYMSPDGKYVVTTQYGGNVISFIDAKKHEIIKEITVGEGKHVGFVTFTKDGRKAFVSNREDDAVYVVDMKNLEVKKKIDTTEPDKKWKSQGQVLNGYHNIFEVTETYYE